MALFRVLLVSILLVVFLFGGALFLFLQPHIESESIRVSKHPETIRAEWVAWACGGTERITEIVKSKDNNYEGPLSIRVPSDVLNPELSDAAFPGNIFVLTGFRYEIKRTNVITGKVRIINSRQFDVVSWRVELPYRKVNSEGDVEGVHEPLSWTSTTGKIAENIFVGLEGGSC